RRCATACVEVFNYYGRRSINYRKYRKILNDDCGRHGYDHQLDPCLNGEEQFNWETKSTTIASSSGLENRQNHLSIFRTLIKIFGIEWRRFFGVRQR
uniref:Uncharacterized protein n=1 Tax=Romanomermis culicivorax TaxID=13658 RepID=A0A915IJM5_ROMCU